VRKSWSKAVAHLKAPPMSLCARTCAGLEASPRPGQRLAEQQHAAAHSIADVRKALACLRRGWRETQLDARRRPLYLSDALALSAGGGGAAEAVRLQDFALQFVLAHHQKRGGGGGGGGGGGAGADAAGEA